MSEKEDKVRELVNDLGRIIYIQKHSPESWDNLVPEIKESWLEVARRYFKRHPELAVVDREAELPEILKIYVPVSTGICAQEDMQRTMLKAGWVKEVL